ncbi:hypothetical protein TorRG33x02_298000 [Trema orientale]|uniref:Uncharacterized protein n=1 Tax=Trema orientale TaxID=63057 RepID=A0A2P5C4J0_TREOI|nr:hypothetical protein TorRG33x02_298000 [Trema orientale]
MAFKETQSRHGLLAVVALRKLGNGLVKSRKLQLGGLPRSDSKNLCLSISFRSFFASPSAQLLKDWNSMV